MAISNNFHLHGNIVREIECRNVQVKGVDKSVANFTVAVNTGDKADFFPIVAWGKTAEIVSTYASKGRTIDIEGYLQPKSIEYKEGDKIKKINACALVATEVMLGTKSKTLQQETTASKEEYVME